MRWLAWRQLRAQAAVLVAALVVVVVALVATRPHLVEVYGPSGDGELTGFYVWLRLLGTVLIGLPAVIGAFWGAPMIAGELEERTHRLAWTQSITRDRWLTVKLALTAAVAMAVVGIFAAVFTWWSAPIDASAASRISPANFAQRGFVSIGYTLFALTIGVLLGAVARRTLPAMAATFVAFFIVRMAIQKLVRPHLASATTLRTDLFGPGPAVDGHSPHAPSIPLAIPCPDRASRTISPTCVTSPEPPPTSTRRSGPAHASWGSAT